MAFTRRTEIRHISPAELGKVAQLLNPTFAWKKLMQIVPYELTHPEHLNEGKPKYDFNHLKLVENASFKLNKAPAQIFLEEWVTTGRIRPTLSHLLQLLIKSELFRAADHVAVNLLNEEPPQRPSKGPAAKVNIDLPQDDEVDVQEIILAMNYPNSSEIINLNNGHIPSKEIRNKEIFDRTSITDIPISEVDLIQFSAVKSTSINVQAQENSHRSIQSHQSTSTLNRNTQRPEDTDIHNSLPREILSYSPSNSSIRTESTPNYEINESTDYLTSAGSSSTSYEGTCPQISLLNGNFSHHSVQQIQDQPTNSSSDNVFPNVSLLNIQSSDSRINVQSYDLSKSNLHDCEDDVNEFPNLSVLNLTKPIETQLPELEFDENIPQLSALIQH